MANLVKFCKLFTFTDYLEKLYLSVGKFDKTFSEKDIKHCFTKNNFVLLTAICLAYVYVNSKK